MLTNFIFIKVSYFGSIKLFHVCVCICCGFKYNLHPTFIPYYIYAYPCVYTYSNLLLYLHNILRFSILIFFAILFFTNKILSRWFKDGRMIERREKLHENWLKSFSSRLLVKIFLYNIQPVVFDYITTILFVIHKLYSPILNYMCERTNFSWVFSEFARSHHKDGDVSRCFNDAPMFIQISQKLFYPIA
jgi:hypothetical protein